MRLRHRRVNEAIYNCLSSVEDAHAEITRNESKEKAHFLMASSAILRKYNLHEQLGVRLLHRHNSICHEEQMVELRATVNGVDALVSKPLPFQLPICIEAVPTVWTFVDGQYEPLEYSTDPLAQKIFSRLDIPDSMLSDFSNLIFSSPIGMYFGLSIVERQFYESNSPGKFPLEYTDNTERRNIIYLCDVSLIPLSIETAWSFKKDIDGEITNGCSAKTYCAQRCNSGCFRDSVGSHFMGHSRGHENVFFHEPDYRDMYD